MRNMMKKTGLKRAALCAAGGFLLLALIAGVAAAATAARETAQSHLSTSNRARTECGDCHRVESRNRGADDSEAGTQARGGSGESAESDRPAEQAVLKSQGPSQGNRRQETCNRDRERLQTREQTRERSCDVACEQTCEQTLEQDRERLKTRDRERDRPCPGSEEVSGVQVRARHEERSEGGSENRVNPLDREEKGPTR